ncbi:MAG: shikimate dehydrogenase [Actinobacteria bacterium HGW-Actinobacteria-7]|jgi:shikimate dehydrogenase|nr:MAG: shikimate dehydrogenase [Actinobacteria bacterium HGW-Actinobacteria-7]
MISIDGATKLAGVIGNPIGHTLSPAMHNAAYETLGLNWVYVPLLIKDEIGLRRFAAAAAGMSFVGFNITMPFKQGVLELCDEVAMAATMAGAVNTVHCVDGRLLGYNTDGRGLVESLESEANFDVAGKRVVILGAGGAAGSALVSFVLSRAAEVVVLSRDPDAAEILVDRVRPHLNDSRAEASSLADAEQHVGNAELIVNATSLGMRSGDPSPVDASWLHEGQVVYDMVYGRRESTTLLTDARAAGARGFDGLGMLVAQGATAIDIWNGDDQLRTPRDVMRQAAEEQLATRGVVE